jgi:uncharacterized protein (DUF302 family)
VSPTSGYTFGIAVSGDFDEVIGRVTSALGEEGFGVLSTIDVSATLKAKIDLDMPRYTILGACNPPLAATALEADPEIGALLPCNVFLRQDPHGVRVGFMDPASVLGLVDSDAVEDLAAEVTTRLERVCNAL